jgi:hypothetical protein
MDFSFNVRPLEYKVSVAAEHYTLSILTVEEFLLDGKDGTTPSDSSITNEQGTYC